jgi:NAD(P)H-quinone oxidoreductase subunit 5
VLVGTIGAFAARYLHRESGYNRFFLLNAIFLLGMIAATTSESIETLFIGWELVGLSSALLVAYFQERTAPVLNGQRVWSMYRFADAAFLIAAVALHRLPGHGQFNLLTGKPGDWPFGTLQQDFTPTQVLAVGLLLLVAVAGKSALIPFSGWLPRAMEGPTPSSAIFYGALSVHLGAFLLLRISPLLDASFTLSIIVIVLGLATALFAALTSRVQSDVKTALAYASLTQVGIIVAEIGAGCASGLYWVKYVALIHIIGHACLRTLQLVRAPNLLHDYHTLENAIGAHLPGQPGWAATYLPQRLRTGLYRLCIERGYFDSFIDEYLVRPFLAIFRWCDSMERAWTSSITRNGNGKSENQPGVTPAEEQV